MHSYISGIILHCSGKPQSSKLGKLVILCPKGSIFFTYYKDYFNSISSPGSRHKAIKIREITEKSNVKPNV